MEDIIGAKPQTSSDYVSKESKHKSSSKVGDQTKSGHLNRDSSNE